MNVAPSSVLGERYELGEVIGRGATSVVYRGTDLVLHRAVAIKCFDHRLRPTTRDGSDRFEAEARILAGLTHPGIVAVFDLGLHEDTPYLVMECLPGETLADEIRRAGPLMVERMQVILHDVLGALGAAHAQGVLHRDIKPSNVLLTPDGHAKLADFGIATSGDTHDLTETGMVVGTPSYLAPERLVGEPASVSTDLYSVGVMSYEALTGVRPFRGETPVAVSYAICHADLAPFREHRPDIARPVDAVVTSAMARDPGDRFESARDLLAAFEDSATRDSTYDDETLPVRVVSDPTSVMPTVAPRPDPEPTVPRRRNTGARVAVVGAIVGALAVGAVVIHDRSSSTGPTRTPTSLPAPLQQPFDQLQKPVRP